MSSPKYTSTILITGGTQGLGYHAALSLASSQPRTLIVLASRTNPTSADGTINTKTSQSNVIYTPLDLGSLSTVRSFVAAWKAAARPPISALLLNAGVQFPTDITRTPDGIESHFGINHVGHALLFHLLYPYLTPKARIIVTSSGLHDPVQAKEFGGAITPRYKTAERAAHPSKEDQEESSGRDRYATSKAANAIWTFALSRHLAHTAHAVLLFDPGLMFGTQFARDAGWMLRVLNKKVLPKLTGLARVVVNPNINPPSEAGGKLAWLATSSEMEGVKGRYFETRRDREASVQARDEGCQEELWRWTIERVRGDGEEGGVFEKFE